MKLVIKFPTRNRKNKFLNTLKKYDNLLSKKIDVRFLITMDEDDTEMNCQDVKEILNTYSNLTFFYGNSKNKIDAVNKDLDKIEDWDIVLLASDDMIPVVKGYDEIIVENMKKLYPDTDGVLWFNDGFQGEKLNTLSILGKKYYDRFGYIYNPEYKSVWCDNEFMSVANILGKQTYIKEIIIKHEHPDYGYGKRDEIHVNNFKNESSDRDVFNKRKLINFGL
jgi:hypothetical protein